MTPKPHVITIDTREADADSPHPMYRWRCSCSCVGEWKLVARSARIGGQRHVAAMERGR